MSKKPEEHPILELEDLKPGMFIKAKKRIVNKNEFPFWEFKNGKASMRESAIITIDLIEFPHLMFLQTGIYEHYVFDKCTSKMAGGVFLASNGRLVWASPKDLLNNFHYLVI